MKKIVTLVFFVLLISSSIFGQEVKPIKKPIDNISNLNYEDLELISKSKYLDEILKASRERDKLKPIFKKVNLGGGDYYEGYMLNGKKEGKGKLFIKQDGIFEGEFKNDKFHGFGKWTMNDGEILEHEYKNDQTIGFIKRTKNGKVTYGNYDANGNFIEEKNNNVAKSDVNEKSKTTSIYKTLNYKDGGVYVGNTINNIRNGKGKFTTKNGENYEGNWINGSLEGFGTFTNKLGDEYRGNFNKNERNGKGIFKYANGEFYDGDWLDGQRNGFGKYTHLNGNIFECEYKDGVEIGKIKVTKKDGTILFGTFDQDGKFIEEEDTTKPIYKVVNYDNGTYMGDMIGNSKEGFGKFMFLNGSIYEGDWKNNKVHGNGIIKMADGAKYEGEWKNGKMDGKGKMYDINGILIHDGLMKDNKPVK